MCFDSSGSPGIPLSDIQYSAGQEVTPGQGSALETVIKKDGKVRELVVEGCI
jgi:hypothetical protein